MAYNLCGNKLLKLTLVLLILISASLGLVSCTGVSQAEFDLVSKDLDDARASEQQISNELAVAQSKIKDIEVEAQSKIKDIEAELDDARIRQQEARLVIEVLNEFINIGITGDVSNIMQLFGKLAEIENEEIQESVQYLMQYGDVISEDEAGMIVFGWLEEVERMLK